ncbi:alanine racemase [Sulfurospirillum barnesii]|uniref:Alanine racemase n=1 Tax=Sulfurospirillum barnesii (strain ATCC 700032 / DSM 10660 / SES-3) TaxID=760154 RepID=I3XUW2_SULBS|nr:alanine racemase [Sulfurospirillum barnesii]AFL67736.1 alanine racemase [Sulfurospirillum barnesii SES-3]
MAFITLNKAHLFHNLDTLSAKAGGKQKVMAVLKDNAYGHGLRVMAELCFAYGLRRVAVKNIEEAMVIADLFDEVLVLVDTVSSQKLPQNISFSAHSYEMLEALVEGESIHLSLDTGMHRNGIKEDEIEKAMALIVAKKLSLKGVFTHFRSSDELNAEFFWQRTLFERAKKRIKILAKAYDLPEISFHCCNSAGLLRTQTLGDDAFARVGIAMYGYSTLHPSFTSLELKPVLALWAEKLSSRVLKKGERVGYGGVYEAPEDELISTYDIGYGDGFFRFNGLEPVAMADGRLSKGRMSMDSFCLGGDAQNVCMFDNANALAKQFKTINYEIPTKLSSTLKRIVI